MLVIREIQTCKLKEFNEALKKKIERDRGEDVAALGGRGLAVSYTSLYRNQTGMMDCYYVDVVIMQNHTTSRRCCTSVHGSRQMNTGRQSGLRN